MLDDPDIQAILLNVRNVTEQSQHRAAAEKLESYRACPDYALLSKTPDGVVLDWNPGAQKAFGYSADAMVGNSIEILVPLEMLAEERSARERISRGEEVPVFPTTRIRKDGGRVKINLSLAAVRDGRGNVKAITHLSHVLG